MYVLVISYWVSGTKPSITLTRETFRTVHRAPVTTSVTCVEYKNDVCFECWNRWSFGLHKSLEMLQYSEKYFIVIFQSNQRVKNYWKYSAIRNSGIWRVKSVQLGEFSHNPTWRLVVAPVNGIVVTMAFKDCTSETFTLWGVGTGAEKAKNIFNRAELAR